MDKKDFWRKTPILGMLHLAGGDPVRRALEEFALYEDEGVDGVIVENYHGAVSDVQKTIEAIQKRGTLLEVGVNILPNNYQIALHLAEAFGCSFIQLDYVAGKYDLAPRGINLEHYLSCREKRKDILVLGGVWPKYYTPLEGSDLENDLREGMERADAIVVTGEETGMKTPLEKIREFRRVLGDYPLIIGAGLTPYNVYEQLLIAEGAIVGSYFKRNMQTNSPVDRERVQQLMTAVHTVRKEKL